MDTATIDFPSIAMIHDGRQTKEGEGDGQERSEPCHRLHFKSQQILWRIFRCLRSAELLLRSRRSCWDHRVLCIVVQKVLPPVKLNKIQNIFRQNFHCWTFYSERIVLKQVHFYTFSEQNNHFYINWFDLTNK